MEQSSYTDIITEQTKRALWEVKNVIDCVPSDLWSKRYCEMPLYKHIYHMLHSLDRWFVNPYDTSYKEPSIHIDNLNNLDVKTEKYISKEEITEYCKYVEVKIEKYLKNLRENALLEKPTNCPYTRFTLIMAQHRHLHSHMGMIMGFIIDDKGLWPRVLGLQSEFPQDNYDKYF